MSKTVGESGAAPTRTRRTKSKAKDELAAGLEQTVAAYLRSNPDFFARNPEVLAGLSVPHATGEATSLIEHQVKVLRRQLETERTRLVQLINRAREYESLASRLHALMLQLISAGDLEHVRAVLREALMQEFSAQAVTLRLFALDAADPVNQADPLAAAFREFLGRNHAVCGPLDADKSGILFAGDGAAVHCAALVPIRADGCCGVLAIGATDPDRFKPDMRTDLLDQLGEIVSHKLRVLAVAPAAL